MPVAEVSAAELQAPRFLFINSANQNPENFVHRGGLAILKFWLGMVATYPLARLYLRCARPSDDALVAFGIDVAALRGEETRSIVWIQEFVSHQEMARLMSHVHFFLLPSVFLHSVSIMHAMAQGAVPVVSDTIGTSCYVTHGENGIVLQGVRESNWQVEPTTGVTIDDARRNSALEDDLARQMQASVSSLIEDPAAYRAMREGARRASQTQFSGETFCTTFWEDVHRLWGEYVGLKGREGRIKTAPPLPQHGLLQDSDWPRVFESVPQPMTRIRTGRGRVTELGGMFIYTAGDAKMSLQDWSVLAEYWRTGAPPLAFVRDISEFGGKYLAEVAMPARHTAIDFVSRQLLPFPRLHRLAARCLKFFRRVLRKESPRDKPPHVDIQLVAQDIAGMNVIRCNAHYYAIPQDGGAFSEEKANHGGYRLCFKGNSLKHVLSKVSEYERAFGQAMPSAMPEGDRPIMAEEGFLGFNIVRHADLFFAIPQGEGAFAPERVSAGGYSRMYTGPTLEAAKAAVEAGK
ncbi:MAG: hypothetical protein B7Z80_21030 [Rhodospirillales bacterium 20-64-7]|nr:MAG: hypothetical protein B7Z80_21030 [Rhodospirillales bacterium 20-64-7]